MQAIRRGRQCLTAGGNVPTLDQAATNTLLQLTTNLVVYRPGLRSGLLAHHRAGVISLMLEFTAARFHTDCIVTVSLPYE